MQLPFLLLLKLLTLNALDVVTDPPEPEILRPRFGGYFGRIINGSDAREEFARHQVSLRRRLRDQLRFGAGHICGGSLIRNHVVLTAAHCFVDQVAYDGSFQPIEDFIVVAGTLNRFKANAHTLSLDLIKRVMPLDRFVIDTYDKDIALLFLSNAVPSNHPVVRTIALPDLSFKPKTMCQVTGWGRTETGYNAAVLRTVDVPLISTQDCLANSQIHESLILPGMLCAGYMEEGQRDACSGDSGGPLVCQNRLVGIVSWGIKCGLPHLPGVYTDVFFYREWIEENLRKNAFLEVSEKYSDVGGKTEEKEELSPGRAAHSLLYLISLYAAAGLVCRIV